MQGVSVLFPDDLEEGDEVSTDRGVTWYKVEGLHVDPTGFVRIYTPLDAIDVPVSDHVWVR